MPLQRGIISICGFMLFGCYEISLYEMSCFESLTSYLYMSYLEEGFLRLLFMRVDCEVNRPSFLGVR
jgi:hypothetical protein